MKAVPRCFEERSVSVFGQEFKREKALTSPEVWLKMLRGMSPRKWTPLTKARGRRRLRSTVVRMIEGTTATLLSSFTTVMSGFFSSLESVDAGFSSGMGGRPLWTQRAMAVIVKFTAINMALGRYVPILTKRLACIRR